MKKVGRWGYRSPFCHSQGMDFGHAGIFEFACGFITEL